MTHRIAIVVLVLEPERREEDHRQPSMFELAGLTPEQIAAVLEPGTAEVDRDADVLVFRRRPPAPRRGG